MVPKLRFSFTSALLPHKLGVLTKWSSGGTPSKDNKSYWDGDISWFTAASMKDNELSVSPTKISDLGLANGSRLANKSDILLLVRGSMLFNKIPVGVLLNDAAFNQDVKAIKCLEKFNHRFALQWLLSKESHLLSMVTGTGIGAGKLDTSELQNLDVYLPDYVEQSKIADFLSSVDEKIKLLNKQYYLLCQYKKGMMQKIFSQEVRFKDNNGRSFPKWTMKIFSDFFTIGSSKRVLQGDWVNEGVPFYRTRELVSLSRKEKFKSEIFITEDNYTYLKAKYGVPAVGDFLVSGVGTLGIIHQVKNGNPFYFKDGNVLWFKKNNEISSDFFYHLFNSQKVLTQIVDHAAITTVGTYTIEKAKKTKFMCPSLEEQTKIANLLSSMDDKIAFKKAELDKLKTWKQGLLQQMFI
ncbi:restriction endonuclease subunit S [Enterobacter cloacae complex sp. 2024EL-00711]|uniref:restriction endonuclease subunit S n=1 Tax=Enterobacter cloacae complex sp. 2024EL-00711 TaxID=3350333 RepID=UPI0039E0BF03